MIADSMLTPTDAPRPAPGRHGKLLLNAYGRQCYDAGFESGKALSAGRFVDPSPTPILSKDDCYDLVDAIQTYVPLKERKAWLPIINKLLQLSDQAARVDPSPVWKGESATEMLAWDRGYRYACALHAESADAARLVPIKETQS